MTYTLLVKTLSGWQSKGIGSKEDMEARALKYQAVGYKTKVKKI